MKVAATVLIEHCEFQACKERESEEVVPSTPDAQMCVGLTDNEK